MIGSTHSIVNAALGRLPLPELSIALFTVVKGMTNAVKASDLMARQTAVSLVDDRSSFQTVIKFVWGLCGLLLAVLAILGFTPAGGWVLQNIFGIHDPKHIAFAYSALRITCFLPVAETLRNSYQGLAIGLGKTGIMPLGTVLRVFMISAFLWWAAGTQAVSGIVAGSLAWTVGIAIEGVVVIIYLIARFGSPGEAADQLPDRNTRALTVVDVTRFFVPLGIMMTVSASLQPVIQSGLSRSISPTLTLAAYGVAWGLVIILTGPIRMLHQTSLVFTDESEGENWAKVRGFCLAVGAATSAVVFGVAHTEVGYWLMRRVMALSEPITLSALQALAAFSLFPLIRSVREGYWGVLMRQRRTSMIGGAKVANLLAVLAAVLLVFGPWHLGQNLAPTVLGALAFTLGEAVETFVIWRHAVSGPRMSSKVSVHA